MEMTGGQALARQLVAEGVTELFGVPGVQLDWATDALVDVADQLRYITPRHEQACAYMADGRARASGEPGVCMVVPGPGLLNAMAGLSTAYACSSPVLCISGQIPSAAIGRGLGLLHEVPNQSGILSSVTKWQALARQPQEIPGLVHQAMRELRSGRPRPVGLEIPPDVLQARTEVALIEREGAPARLVPAAADLDRAAQWLREARLPVIYAGGGVTAADAGNAVRCLAEALQAPVVMTENAKGSLPAEHPLALSTLGGRALWPHADVVLVIGSRFLDGRGEPVSARPGARHLYLNIEAVDAAAPRANGLHLHGDARAGAQALHERVQGLRRAACAADLGRVRDWCERQMAHVAPQLGYLQALRAALPGDGVLVSELTQVGYVANLAWPAWQPRTMITPGYQGTLGYGFPTALGVAIGQPGRPVLSITGDGGFGWNLQELATLAKYRPRLVLVVFADGAYGNVRRIQRTVFQREIGTELCNPDHVALARAFGLQAERVQGPQALQHAAAHAFAAGEPVLIEVPVGPMPGPWHLIHPFSRAPHPAPENPLGAPAT